MLTLPNRLKDYLSEKIAKGNYNQEDSLKIKTFTLIIFFKIFACMGWAGMYLAFGIFLAALFPITIGIIFLSGFFIFLITKRFSLFVNLTLLFMLIIPATLQWYLGGFYESGWVMIWSFLAPLGALVFRGEKEAGLWFLGFLLMVIASVILDPILVKPKERSQWMLTVFLIMNIGFVSSIVYYTILYNINKTKIEHQKSEELLTKILPEKIAKELKERGETMPLFYKSATVLFTDFVGFTKMSEKMKPAELIYELENCFTRFDDAGKRFKIEKLKTIGDAYMCAAGLPERTKTHAIDACLFGLEIQKIINELKIEKEKEGKPFWRLRLGIHSGPVVAGVIGKNKIAYDIWGDTVNTASRMESSGQEGMVNISKVTYDLVKDFFEFENRGKVTAKSKGEVDMYFVIGIKKNLSDDENGEIPNDLFWKMYEEVGSKKPKREKLKVA